VTVFAFVFARGGSKGLVSKNVRTLGGIPLVGHSILTARAIPAVTGVFVSTDSAEIAAASRAHGAEIIDRPPELATDSSPEWLAWQHAIDHLARLGRSCDVFASLPATSPLRAPEDVTACLGALDASTDAVITVTPAHRSPYFNMVTRDADGTSAIVLKRDPLVRRQDAPALYDITTVAYVTRPSYILSAAGLFAGRVRSVIVPKERGVDIDDAFDFAVAEALYAQRNA
jgi:CMP-N-acetylneuraminic acid synthetase